MHYIYRITNKVNGKTYIGQHEYEKLNDSYMGSGVLLKKAQKKYGIENFEKKVLVFNISKKEYADLLEETFIAAEREKVGRENCYNRADGGRGFSGHHSEEAKRKIAEKLKGRQMPQETKRKMAEARKGKHFSEETRKKMSEAQKGENSPFYGKHWKLVDGKRVWY